MGGRIGVRSNPKGGSVFWFTLPLSVAVSESPKIRFSRDPGNYRILIVDDNVLASEKLEDIINEIKSCGFERGAKFEQPKNALLPMVVTELGMMMLVRV